MTSWTPAASTICISILATAVQDAATTYHFYPTTVTVPFIHFSSNILCINGQELGQDFMAHEAVWSNFCVNFQDLLTKIEYVAFNTISRKFC